MFNITGTLVALLLRWTERYGHVFGYFEGHTPILVVSDPDVLYDIFVKSFSSVHSRRAAVLGGQQSKSVRLFNAAALRWKRQRFVLNPIFSSLKLKQMAPLIHRRIAMLMSKMSAHNDTGEPFDIYAYYKRFTMDTICSRY